MRATEPKRYGVIYVFVCAVNGKKYVGQTTARYPVKYCRGHLRDSRNGSKKVFHAAIRKHGEDNFSFGIVWTAFDKASLDWAEDHFINYWDTLAPRGYNIKTGGSAGKLPKDVLAVMSAKAKGFRWINDGAVDKKFRGKDLPVGWTFGRVFEVDWTPEMRETLSAAIRAACTDPEVRKHKSDAMAEVWQRAEHRDKIAETNAKPEVVARKSAAMSASHGTSEFREAAKRRAISQFSTPEAREAHRQRSLEQHADPEKHARNVAARRLAGSRGNKGWRWITDGIETRQMLGTDPLPDGYHYGDGHVRNAGKNWITDGARNRMIDPEVPIPEGFRLGKTVPRRTASVQAQ